MISKKISEKHVYVDMQSALANAEEAINELAAAGAFRNYEDGIPLVDEDLDDLDVDMIEYHIARLETSFHIVADRLSQLLESNAEEPLTLDEILARYVRQGVVQDPAVVMTAARLAEGLGMVGSTVGDGLGIQEFDSESLTKLVETLRVLVDYLKEDSS